MKKPKELEKECLERLKELEQSDSQSRQFQGEQLLLKLLRDLGMKKVVTAYEQLNF